MTYIFDNTLRGFLCCVFEYYFRKDNHVKVIPQRLHTPSLINDEIIIYADDVRAMRVWKGLQKKITEEWQLKLYCTFLSELPESYQALFDCICYFFDSKTIVYTNYGSEHILAVNKLSRKVQHERHRMKGFIRFQKTKDNMYYAAIEPDHNILPLLSTHFKNRFADQQWIIYDKKRDYGLHYNLHTVEEIQLNFDPQMQNQQNTMLPDSVAEEQEALYQTLWKDYYSSVNIKERKNTKLHTQFLPKRYWRYLSEKQL